MANGYGVIEWTAMIRFINMSNLWFGFLWYLPIEINVFLDYTVDERKDFFQPSNTASEVIPLEHYVGQQ